MATRILLVDDEPGFREALQRLVAALGHEAVLAADSADAIAKLATEPFDLCITDLVLPHAHGYAVLAAARAVVPPVPVIVLAGEGTVLDAVAALRAGAHDFLPKPFHTTVFSETVDRVLDDRAGSAASATRTKVASVIGEHPAMRLMLERIEQVAGTDASVLVRGESGTGKTVVARLLHAASARRTGPFVRVSVTSIPEAVAEADLFGLADAPSSGRIWAAQHGTLFLDEIGELSLPLQEKLVRVLQERAVQPLGGDKRFGVDVRIIAATNRNLEQLVRDGAFREDLLYRLNVIPIELPPLRNRPEDVPLLAQHFRDEANARDRRQVPPFSADVLARLAAYEWPGNVRQLEVTVQRLVGIARDRAVDLNDLPANLRNDLAELPPAVVDLPPTGVDLRLLLSQLEQRLIGQALERTGGNKNRAAELLGMNRTTLVEKLRRRNAA